jgi:hypothetical protein
MLRYKMKTRLWCFTSFNLDIDYASIIDTSTAEYIAYGVETCPSTGKTHHQGFIYFSGARGSKKQVGKLLLNSHCDMCRGNLDQNTDYCAKQNDLIEFGVKPKQGFRTDLDAVKELILEQKLSVDEICVENPNLYHQYGRTLNKLEDIALRKRFRNFMTKGIWLYGKTGTGKSHFAYQGFHPDTHYDYPNDGGWWDGYTGQETVIINEFRGNMFFMAELLSLCDKYPKTVRRRGREPVPFLAKSIIITSCSKPEIIYCNQDENDSISQLYRRFDVRKCTFNIVEKQKRYYQNGTEVV